MDTSLLGMARNCGPVLPDVLWTAALSLLGKSSNSQHQDTLTEAIVKTSRPILQTPAPLLQAQLRCNRDLGVGRPWIAKYTITVPPEDTLSDLPDGLVLTIRQAVEFAIRKLDKSGSRRDGFKCPVPELADVEIEWTFYSALSLPINIPFALSEQERYNSFMKKYDSNAPTILHFHGGAFCLMDPSTHRWMLSNLAKYSHGRVMSVRYRLSPQSIFPGALLDALQAYLSLLSPPPDSYHQPVPANKIIISGDSSGGNLASSLVLLLLSLARNGMSISFHGTNVVVPSPPCAGLSVVSPWLDLTRSLPSTTQNVKWDIIAPPALDAASPPFPPDEIWPTSPPRAETYCAAHMVTHPLVSPVAAASSDWVGAPPIYIVCGWEGFTDEIEVFARRAFQSSDNAIVRFDGWMGMPHCFCSMPWNRAGRTAMANWGVFCSQASKGEVQRIETAMWSSSVRSDEVKHIKISDLGTINSKDTCGYDRQFDLDDQTVDDLMEKGRVWRVGLEEEMIRKYDEANEARKMSVSLVQSSDTKLTSLSH